MAKSKIYYATSNHSKIATIQQVLSNYGDCPFEIVPIKLDISEIQSDFQREVALDKAQKAFVQLQKPVLVDDEGMFFDAYSNFPGTNSKFVIHNLGLKGAYKLLDEQDTMTFRATLAYKDEKEVHIFQAECHGRALQPLPENYVSLTSFAQIFIPDGEEKVFDKLRDSENFENYNFRGNAFREFIEWYLKNKISHD